MTGFSKAAVQNGRVGIVTRSITLSLLLSGSLLAGCARPQAPTVSTELAVCGGIIGATCSNGQVCDLPAGTCSGADMQGSCIARPEFCIEIYAPVCGCDGQTYSNDCFRLMAAAQKSHDGEC